MIRTASPGRRTKGHEEPIKRTADVRDTFTFSRSLEFLSEPELTKQIGHDRECWLRASVKELIDNSMDHCEEIRQLPEISVKLTTSSLSVHDNGDGIPPSTVVGMLDFNNRTSSRETSRTPTRGAMGLGGKCVIAVPFVLNGSNSRAVCIAKGVRHEIAVGTDILSQEAKITHEQHEEKVHFGTFWELHFGELPSILEGIEILHFVRFCERYATLNPDLSLSLELPDGTIHTWTRTLDKCTKWTAAEKEPPGWHSNQSFDRLLSANIAKDRANGTDQQLRDFLKRTFAGLKRSDVLKAIADETGLTRAPLSALLNGNGLDAIKTRKLLASIQKHGKTPLPKQLGQIGKEHFSRALEQMGAEGAMKYRKIVGTHRGLPFVVEAACAETHDCGPKIVTGVNFSPSIDQPIVRIDWLLV